MISSMLMRFLVNSYLIYPIISTIAIGLIAKLIYEYKEYQIKKLCKQQNLKYVRLPSQLWALISKKRFDIIEDELIEKHGKVFGSNMVNDMTIYVADAELAQIVCVREFTKFANRRTFTLYDPIWDNLMFAINDEKWKRLRAIMSPAFATGKLRKFKSCIDDTYKIMAENLINMIAKDPIVNVKKIIGAFTMDTIILISMGMRINSLQNPDCRLIRYARQLFGQNISIRDAILFFFSLICPKLLKILNLRFQAESIDYFKECVLKILKEKREEMKHRNGSRKATNFIEIILEIEQEQESESKIQNGDAKPFKHITNDELIAQCVTFFTVGYDTTATTITNVCYALATNPEKQEKLHNNIIETLDQLVQERDDGCEDPYELITFDSLNRFEYLNAVINETMRFITLVLATERIAAEDCRLETSDKKIWFDVRKGDCIRIAMQNLHMNPEYFSNPDQFIPERFLSSDSENGERFTKSAFMPFGIGPRKCVASNLALLEVKMALVHLFRMFRMSVDEKTQIPLDFYINTDILVPKDVYLRIEQR